MSIEVTGAKLQRLAEIAQEQQDVQALYTLLTRGYQTATEIQVRDIGGENLRYHVILNGHTSPNGYAIPKALVEVFNAQLLEEAEEPEEFDPNSLETLKSHLDLWIGQSLSKGQLTLTEDDVVKFISVSGTKLQPRFIFTVAKFGKLDPSIIGRQVVVRSNREDIADKLEGILTVTSKAPADIVAQILTAVNGEGDLDVTKSVLLAEDVVLPVTHFADSTVYPARIGSSALDYFGNFQIKVELTAAEEEEEEEVEPEQEPEGTDPEGTVPEGGE